MNTPNKLSLIRVLIIPVILFFLLPVQIFSFHPEKWNEFVATNGRLIACFLFIGASITDYADGKIARKYNMVTNLGKFLDALADKMLVIAVLVAFVQMQRISSAGVVIIILRELMVSGVRMVASEKGVVIAANTLGKIKTVTQMTAIIFILLEPLLTFIFRYLGDSSAYIPFVGTLLFFICVVMTIISGLDYLLKNLAFFKD